MWEEGDKMKWAQDTHFPQRCGCLVVDMWGGTVGHRKRGSHGRIGLLLQLRHLLATQS